jgi:hypothetical protein
VTQRLHFLEGNAGMSHGGFEIIVLRHCSISVGARICPRMRRWRIADGVKVQVNKGRATALVFASIDEIAR